MLLNAHMFRCLLQVMFIAGFCNCDLSSVWTTEWDSFIKSSSKNQTKTTLNLFRPDGKIVCLGLLGLCFKHILAVIYLSRSWYFRPSLFVTVIASTLMAYILPSLFESDLTEIKTLNSFLSSLISDRKSIMIITTLIILVSSKMLLHFLNF